MASRFSRQTLVAAVAFGLTVPLGALAQQDRAKALPGAQPAAGITQPAAGTTQPAVGTAGPAARTTQPGLGAAPPAPPTTLMTMPQAVERDGVRYLTGGVGHDEREAMRAAARDFNLYLSFAQHGTGAFVALVDVAIRDAQGREVVSIPQAGPILMAQLPRGTYNVEATYEGRTQTRQVSVGDRMTREYLTWQQTGQPRAS
jgi:hypothetical protein